MPTPTSPRALVLVLAASAVACGGGGEVRGTDCANNLLPGDLVITEVFANPAGTDDGKEWFEIYNATKVAQELGGIILRSAKADGSGVKEHAFGSLSIEAEGYIVVGGVLDDVKPEFVDYGYGNDLGDLRNSSGLLEVACGDAPIDRILYEENSDSTSRGFDGSRTPDASGNDDLLAWCDATTMYSDDVIGTPGAQNDPCAGVGVPGMCSEDGVMRATVAPLPGSLVISEVYAAPVDGVTEGEWFEIYVAQDADLNGVGFGKKVDDELTDPPGLVGGVECVHATAGSYVVVAHSDDPATNGGLPQVDALFDFALVNGGGPLFLSYGEDVLDEADIPSTDAGVAQSLDPDYLQEDGNDDASHFCDAITAFGDGGLGTPGAPNDAECAIAPPTGQCNDGTGFVDVVLPVPGDLVITEFHANPDAVDDAAGEWFELRANAPVHLNGLELGTVVGEVKGTIEAEDCIALGVGDYAVVARGDDASSNGGLPVVNATFGFALGNSNSGLFVASEGTLIDEIAWTSSTAGAATSLDATFTNAADNDDELNWCPAVDPYGDGDLGTPGEENPQCGGTTPSTCIDGGTRRMVVAPQVGDLVITELMPDPSAVGDADAEWFEVLVTADVDLDGLQLGTDPSDPDVTLPQGGDCISVAAGTRVVFARNDDAAANGGLDPVLATFSFGLANGGGTLFVGYVGEVLDQITWSGSSPGTASSLDPDAEDPVANDDQGNFCDASTVYGAGDLGTPGSQGEDCSGGGGDGMCDDGGTPRAVVSPTAGDLLITEVMANPSAVADSAGEWFEVRVTANVDLNGLEIYRLDDMATPALEQTIDGDACLEVTSGSRIVIARNATMAMNGGLPVVDYVFAFDLVNSNDGIGVGVGGTVLDSVTWTSVPTGGSRSLDPGITDPDGNDLDANWCPAVSAYGDGDLGTPAAANDAC